ncbi:hypothetical protein [Agitococcus lubricus]|uniref:Uncharacterized protein n=1 Tax=Agitococcus lubricus TaxID=1077255 RepID=A0A2T5ITB0_9GAMM|nr:hypothetical protein [Agitococcus lubricus]PTQ87065.1 hypothetical protein C8N29_12510 [Agitococcus lubricus]
MNHVQAASSVPYYLAICHFEVPTTENNPEFIPSVSVCLGMFSTHREAFNTAREYADANYAALIGFSAVRHGGV